MIEWKPGSIPEGLSNQGVTIFMFFKGKACLDHSSHCLGSGVKVDIAGNGISEAVIQPRNLR